MWSAQARDTLGNCQVYCCAFCPKTCPTTPTPQVKDELERKEKLGVIAKVDQPTPWCAGMVVVPKKEGAIRICVDLKPLNENVLREVHPLPKVDETLAQLSGATVFSKLDANGVFWQISLAEKSQLLTTFIIPFGRYCFHKMPFGISRAPEHFQKRMTQMLSGLDGVLCLMDDVLVFGKDRTEHDERHTSSQKSSSHWSHPSSLSTYTRIYSPSHMGIPWPLDM